VPLQGYNQYTLFHYSHVALTATNLPACPDDRGILNQVHIHGDHSAVLRSGVRSEFFQDPSPVTLRQSGVLSSNASVLTFITLEDYTNRLHLLDVNIDNNRLDVQFIKYEGRGVLCGADISDYAGQTVDLRFTLNPYRDDEANDFVFALDDITILESPISHDVGITKTVVPSVVQPGHLLTYTVTVSNTSPNPITGVRIEDREPHGVRFVSHAVSQGAYAPVDIPSIGVIKGWDVGSLPAFGTATWQITARAGCPSHLPRILPHPNPLAAGFFGRDATALGEDRYLVTGLDTIYLYDLDDNLERDDLGALLHPDELKYYDVVAFGTDRFLVSAKDPVRPWETEDLHLMHTNGTILLTIPDTPPYHSMSAVGDDLILLSDPNADPSNVINAGEIRLYDPDGQMLNTITNPAPGFLDYFGRTMAPFGPSNFVVGVSLADIDGTNNTGIVYIYDLDGTRTLTITNPAPLPDDRFGGTLCALDDNTLIVAALGRRHGAHPGQGTVYLFDRSGNLLNTIPNPNPAFDSSFGISLSAMSSNRFAVGGFSEEQEDDPNIGSTYIFDRAGHLIRAISTPNHRSVGSFGRRVVGLGPDQLLITAPNWDLSKPFGHTPGRCYRVDLQADTMTVTNRVLLVAMT
ncbi:MAG: DUF11 domain-containing protein, partial [Verrucomicrobiota bacterium]